VSQRQFPISTTVTGALMQIKPGALREPHWHPNADEWQYYISGRARMTVFGSHGRVRTEEFNAGDVGYVPQGYGHYIENIGNEDVELLIALNNGTYESISLADWIGANPHLLLATKFRGAGKHVQGFPDAQQVPGGVGAPLLLIQRERKAPAEPACACFNCVRHQAASLPRRLTPSAFPARAPA